jgi:hypothetical protein
VTPTLNRASHADKKEPRHGDRAGLMEVEIMQKLTTTTPKRRKATSCPPDLFGWASESELLTEPNIRRVMRRAHVPAATARVIAELAGLNIFREASRV